MSAFKQTVHRVLVRNAQLRSPIVWKWRGGEAAGRARSKKGKQNRDKPAEKPEQQLHVVELQEKAGRDPELHVLLSLATDDELEHIVNTLHGGSPFSPLVKSLVIHGSERQHGWELKHAPREQVELYIETRFRFLAADASCIMNLQDFVLPSYREALLYLREKLRVDCRTSLDTPDLEMEVFLHLVSRTSRGSLRGIQVMDPDDVLPTLAKTAASVQVAKRVLVEGAKQRLVGALAEFTTVRSIYSFVGPLLVASAAFDLAMVSLGPDSTRLAKIVALLAQVRLLRTHGWVAETPPPSPPS
jgi:hypothetical protein